MTSSFLPYGRQFLDDEDIRAVTDVLRGDWLTTGPKVAEFEQAFASKMDAKHAVVCNSGTAALHLAAMAVGLGKDDVVIAPAMSFAASATAPRLTGAEIVFADCDPETGLITPELLLEALERAGDAVKAIVVVHLNGQCCDMEAIGKIAKQRGLILIEDACHAAGSRYRDSDGKWHRVGACAHSDMACYSLHPVKTITMGEGGMVTTKDFKLAETMRCARSHGMVHDPDDHVNREMALGADGQPNPWYYEIQQIGPNYRASDIACALGLTQLAKLDRFAERRKALEQHYDQLFADFDAPAKPFRRLDTSDHVLHLYVLHIDFDKLGTRNGVPADRAYVMRALREKGIGTQVHYIPTHKLPYYADRYGAQTLAGAENYYQKALSIPLYPAMEDKDAERVVKSLSDVLRA